MLYRNWMAAMTGKEMHNSKSIIYRFANMFGNVILSGTLLCGASIAMAQTAIPLPKATLMPVEPWRYTSPDLTTVSRNSVEFGSADRSLRPEYLSQQGYVEEEYLISGTANVYDFAGDGKLMIKFPNAPYGTRIRVRHPKDPAKFSGAVVVEIPNGARRFDWDMLYGYLADEIIRRGDGWVGLTPPPGTPGLKVFDPVRYKDISYANPMPNACPTAGDQEEGLRWDMYSQVAALIKHGGPGEPFAGFKVQAAYMTTQGGDLVTYMNVFHPQAKVAGKFAYDGYLSKQPGGIGRLNQCGTAPPKGDSRHQIRNTGVPVIAVIAQGEVIPTLAAQRPDGDDPNDKFRLYEVAGGSHLDKFAYDPFASTGDAAKAGNLQGTPEFPFAGRCTPEIQLIEYPLMPYAYHAALNHLDNWVRKGVAPPHADRIQVKDADTAHATVMMDQYGNALGGIRTFWVDDPVAQFTQNSTGPGPCAELGHSVPLSWQKLEAIHGDYKSYVAKASASLDKSVKDGWITKADADKMKASLAAGSTGN
jgi:hypothetical protein